jgi:hypothetical protein
VTVFGKVCDSNLVGDDGSAMQHKCSATQQQQQQQQSAAPEVVAVLGPADTMYTYVSRKVIVTNRVFVVIFLIPILIVGFGY